MKKIAVIGDIHGLTIWKDIPLENYDEVIFIGDYFDTRDENVTGEMQLRNFQEIINFKENFKGNVKILMGNHDYHYYSGIERYSGFNQFYCHNFYNEISKAVRDDKLTAIYILDDMLFSHAGLTETWYKSLSENYEELSNKPESVEYINEILKYNPEAFRFSGTDFYGDNITQGPFWVRIPSLIKDHVKKYIQIIGHTSHIEGISSYNHGRIYCVDSLFNRQFLEIQIDKNQSKKFFIRNF